MGDNRAAGLDGAGEADEVALPDAPHGIPVEVPARVTGAILDRPGR